VRAPFAPGPLDEGRSNPRFPPVAVAGNPAATGAILSAAGGPPDTNVEIKPAQDYAVDLVATFLATSPQDGERIVAGVQTVDSNVYVDFRRALPLWWFASVYRAGEISPNSAAYAYAGDADSFILPVTKDVTLTHDQAGWKIPSYDTTRYSVMVGFGLGTDPVYPACLVGAPPLTTRLVQASGYQLVRSAGGQSIGDVIAATQEAWSMPLGGAYLLTFDTSGNGHLSPR